MKLYITEKKTVAEAFVPILGKKSMGAGGLSYVTNNGDVVTWLSGHVLELIDAKDIDPKYGKWDLDTLPIFPDPFVLRPPIDRVTPMGTQNNAHKRKILNNVLTLIKGADEICLATDPDAEGELLGREVIEYSGFTGTLTRVLPTSLEVNDIKKTLASEFPAEKTERVGKSGLARSHIDWIVGINTTRGLTAFNASKISRPLNAGRVQTAVVNVLYMNHVARENFKPQPIYNVKANAYVNGSLLNLNYQPTAGEKAILDAKDEDYSSAKSKALVDQLAARLNGKNGTVTKCEKVRKQEACPKGYSLSDLQIDINNKFGISATDVLEATQSLYDKKYVTYPRTDNNYFPEDAHDYASTILGNIGGLEFLSGISGIDASIKNSNWDTSKFENHHAILPTRMKVPFDKLSLNEQMVYEMVCRRYVMQFLPNFQYDNTTILVDIDGAEFKTSGRISVLDGWKQALKGRGSKNSDAGDDDEDEDGQDGDGKSLPVVDKGTTTTDTKVFTTESVTKIVALYTEAKLLQVLKNPSKFIDSKELKSVLKEREQGIGRESTRATILTQMQVNGFYAIQGKKNFALTDKGIMMAKIAPPMLLDLALTAKLELAFWKIEKGELTYDELMSEYRQSTQEIIDSIRRGECKLDKYLVKHTKCIACNDGTMVQKPTKDKKHYWRCDGCNSTANDDNGKPAPRAEAEQCPKCNNKTLTRFLFKGTKAEHAWYCKPCALVVPEDNKKPVIKLNSCEKCNSHVNYGYSALKTISYWRCTGTDCNTFYTDNKGVMGAMSQKRSGGELKTSPCPKCTGLLKQLTRNSDGKKFWICNNRENAKIKCQASYDDSNDEPMTQVLEVECPSCKTGLLRRKSFQDRHFWGCSNFNNSKKQCKFSAKDNNGEPVIVLNG
ncbi:DNA topoisomerase [Vibrio coralliirubri]|uniref:DNA topoisomerase n=1 Tax=Vibrio coralliirubri TaxID=1516159 RepID=UPI002284846C|nr:DNA topoisomerase [Vibrio coralliirubri]MCY9866138.1 DNA topoisomerase [Vibrio coralliirubri]